VGIPDEFARIIGASLNLPSLLDQAVELVAKRMGVDVCSLYLVDPATRRLWLVANYGYRPEARGHVSLAPDEGLTGEVVSRHRALTVADAASHPRYRYFPEVGEEGFHAYLGVPLSIGERPVGSLVVRTKEIREFTKEEQDTLAAIANQLAGLIDNVRLMEAMSRSDASAQAYWKEVEKWQRPAPAGPPGEREREPLRGKPTSPGIVVAEAAVFGDPPRPEDAGAEAPAGTPAEELAKLERALAHARDELLEIQAFTHKEAGEESALIFGSHLLFLDDDGLRRRLRSAVEGGRSAAGAVESVFDEFSAQLARVRDPHIRERSDDLTELRDRLLAELAAPGGEAPDVRGCVAVVPVLSASIVVELRARGAAGVVAEHGGPTSHGALLSRSFQIPAISGVETARARIRTGDLVALDGAEGYVIPRPDEEIQAAFRQAAANLAEVSARREHLRGLPAETRDGRCVALLANVSLGADLRLARLNGAEGIGLYRTEIPFLVRDTLPTRAEQVRLYARAFEALPGKPVVFRSLDLGGDKFMRVAGWREANPFLGYRSIRISLDHPEEFIAQLQAFQIAAHGNEARILLPLVSRVSELRRAKDLVREASRRLAEEGIAHNDAMPVGVLIEVPAAVEIAPALAREAAFFSIGTNDLAQYTLAVDRGNERVAHLGDPFHPAVLSLIRRTIRAGREAGIPVSVCGELAGAPAGALLLIGLGCEILSMNAAAIPAVKEAVRAASYAELRERAEPLLALAEPDDVRQAWAAIAKACGG